MGVGVRFLPNYLPPTRILLMAVLSYGLYLFYWFYLTWKQYRDHTGREAFPVWHALTLVVPIYGLFRTHAHVRSFKELMVNSGYFNSHSGRSQGYFGALLCIDRAGPGHDKWLIGVSILLVQ